MNRKGKLNIKTRPAWLSVVQQIGSILLISSILCAIAAAAVIGGIIPQDQIPTAALVCLGLGTAIACHFALRKDQKGKLLRVGILTASTAGLLLLGNLALVPQPPLGWFQVTAALVIGGLLAILTAGRGKKRAGKRR